MDALDVIEQVQRSVRDRGIDPGAAVDQGSATVLMFEEPAQGEMAAYPVLVEVKTEDESVNLMTKLEPGQHGNADLIRKRMCSLLSGISLGTKPPTRKLDEDLSRDAIVKGSSPRTRQAAETDADERTAAPSDAKPLRVLRPDGAFDLASARAALEEGTSVITGTACSGHLVEGGGGIALASNLNVMLFPVTEYLKDWVRLMHKAKAGRDRIEVRADVMATRLVGKTNSKGQFRFAKMKPGKYFLFTTMSSYAVGAHDQYVGAAWTDSNTITEYHNKEAFQVNYDDVLEKFVDVKGDDDIVKVTLAPRLTWSFVFGRDTGYPGVLGCH